MVLAHQLRSLPKSPFAVSQIVRALDVSRGSFYRKSTLEERDKKLAVAIEKLHEDVDDTLGHKKLSVLLHTGKNRVRRVMKKYGIKARKHSKKYRYPGKSEVVFDNLANDTAIKIQSIDIVFSDILELKLVDGSRVRGCFALLKDTRQILSLVFDYSMRAELVVTTIQRIDVVDPNSIWHSDQGKQYGAGITLATLLERGFKQSMSRAGTPTDNAYAERFVGIFKHAVVYRRKYYSLGEFLNAAKQWINFYNNDRPHEAHGQVSPNEYAKKNNLPIVPYLTNLTV